jgi:hypothetical protein
MLLVHQTKPELLAMSDSTPCFHVRMRIDNRSKSTSIRRQSEDSIHLTSINQHQGTKLDI